MICHINGQSTFEDDSSLYSFNDVSMECRIQFATVLSNGYMLHLIHSGIRE